MSANGLSDRLGPVGSDLILSGSYDHRGDAIAGLLSRAVN
jgi:hypothetical protein